MELTTQQKLFGIHKITPSFPYDWIEPGEIFIIGKSIGYDQVFNYEGNILSPVLAEMERIAQERQNNGILHLYWMR